ncbi:MAG TPA: hypothetical protein VMJ32_08630 [Pirellulales bacterium]|nr:hypothetical protein [Pirellulales bacterium]
MNQCLVERKKFRQIVTMEKDAAAVCGKDETKATVELDIGYHPLHRCIPK